MARKKLRARTRLLCSELFHSVNICFPEVRRVVHSEKLISVVMQKKLAIGESTNDVNRIMS